MSTDNAREYAEVEARKIRGRERSLRERLASEPGLSPATRQDLDRQVRSCDGRATAYEDMAAVLGGPA